MSLFTPQIPYRLPWVQALLFGINGFLLTSLDMAWPIKPENKSNCIEKPSSNRAVNTTLLDYRSQ
jgi:hypothetical protein